MRYSDSMRINSELWVKAYLRRCAGEGVMAVVVRHGDDRAGAIYLKINRLNGNVGLFGPAPGGVSSTYGERLFAAALKTAEVSESEADAYLIQQHQFDSDIWVIEVEDRAGRHRLDDWLARD